MINLSLPPAPSYLDFLTSKFKFARFDGFDLNPEQLHPRHKPHQRDIVRWMVRKGRAAVFARFGLGKTDIQLGAADAIQRKERGFQLIVAPYDVHQEFLEDAAALGVTVRIIRTTDRIDEEGIYLTNYESVRDGKIDVTMFNMVSLDEASVLRSYGSKTYQEFLVIFEDVKYRFVATATPSPNRYKELIHYAGFLGVMDTGQALTRFFQRDSSQANNLTVYPHMENEFHLWLHSWAVFLQKPSDLGYSDEGYDLPPVHIRWHEVKASSLIGEPDRDGQGVLIRDAAMGLQEAAAVKRESIDIRVAKMMEIISAAPADHYLLWHDLEAERDAIEKAIPTAKAVYGSLDLEERTKRLIDFKNGRAQFLPTKPEISGSGCNFQRHCHRAIFTGIGYKFNDLIQAIHRIVRFQQPHECHIDLIYTEEEREIRASLEAKWKAHDTLAERMQAILRTYGLSTDGFEAEIGRTIGVDRVVECGERFEVARNDCVLECRQIAENSVDLIITSIPFGNHYEYTETYEDFGHNDDNGRFFQQMDFLTPELLRILQPGRDCCIHVKDRIQFGNVTGMGMPTVEPFHADCIAHFRGHGFAYMGLIVVNTDVVRENNQTYRLGWSENAKDSTKMGVGSPEFVLLFRKLPTDRSRSYADDPVTKAKPDCLTDDGEVVPFDPKLRAIVGSGYSRSRWQIDAHAFWRSSGNRLLSPDEMAALGPAKLASLFPQWSLERVYDYEDHVRIGEELDHRHALPSTFMALAPGSHDPNIWHDVNRMLTLNSEQTQRNLVNHICPLQLDIVDRLIDRYSNPGDLIFDPFGGIMTVPCRAVLRGRRGRASELNADYFRDGLRHLRAAEAQATGPTLFDLLDNAEGFAGPLLRSAE